MPITNKTTSEELIDFSNENVVFTKTYTRKVPNYHLFQSLNDELTFTESKVRYTKIRKDFSNGYSDDNKK